MSPTATSKVIQPSAIKKKDFMFQKQFVFSKEGPQLTYNCSKPIESSAPSFLFSLPVVNVNFEGHWSSH